MKFAASTWLSAIISFGLLIQGSTARDWSTDQILNLIPINATEPSFGMGYHISFCPGSKTSWDVDGCTRIINVADDLCYVIPDSNRLGARGYTVEIREGIGRVKELKSCSFVDTETCEVTKGHSATILGQEADPWTFGGNAVYRSFKCGKM